MMMVSETYRLLIGSIGDDSHSVGMTLLEIAFKEAGFFTKNLGIMNRLKDFFDAAHDFDAIFISCMNGHSNLYFEDFPYKLKQFNRKNTEPRVWYLGGNLSVQGTMENVIRRYLRMGFDFVAPKPISCEEIMKRLFKDFARKGIKKRKVNYINPFNTPFFPILDTVNDEPMTDQEFFLTREEVLSTWPTGKGVWEADIAANHSRKSQNFHHMILQRLANGNKPLVQPRTGVAHTSDEINILTFLRKNGLEVSSIQLDAASRKNKYHKAQEGVLNSEIGKTSCLNGYPVPVHGVKGIEEVMEAIDTPFQVRAGSPDHRLVYEIGLAGGASSLEGGFLCYLYPYDKKTSPIQSLRFWKYIDKLVDWYYKTFNIVINREYFGPLTCCLIEPSIPICINIIQSLLSARSGVKCMSVGLAEQGNRSQDIAAIRVLDKMTRLYLAKYGFHNCTISTVYHQYMAAFPGDILKAKDLILNSAITGTLTQTTRIMTKTPVESHQIPTKEDNAEGLWLTHKGIQIASINAHLLINKEIVNREMKLLESEVISIMETIEDLGDGSMAKGVIKAFKKGFLDIPFSPSAFNRNQLITAKDCNGAIRFVNPEVLPFKNKIIDFHKEKINQRMTKERSSMMFEIIEKDITRILKNDYTKWPLDGHYVN
ncbi:MAG: methylaspartate mutase subunit E [Candidatus Aminicenantes bacterium]|jgi:methylaspartate mutase epsilon subunit